MAITDKAEDANQRTIFEQFYGQRMGVDQADVAWAAQAGASGALPATACDRRDSVYRAKRSGLAFDAA